jgi:hypothetical protein
MLGLACGLLAAALGAHLELSVNGNPLTEAGAAVFPGGVNRLVVRTPEIGPGRTELKLVRIQPDGRRNEQSARLAGRTTSASFDLGLLAVPCRFDYEAGTIWRRACRWELFVSAANEPPQRRAFYASVGPGDTEIILPGDAQRVPHLGWSESKTARPLDPPILLWLAPEVLTRPNDVRVMYRRRGESAAVRAEPIRGCLRVTAESGGQVVFEKQIQVGADPGATSLDVARWTPGRYRIECVPQVEGFDDRQGPVLVYHRAVVDSRAVPLSPLAPWHFQRDATRSEVRVVDRAALDSLRLNGMYAVFVTPGEEPLYVQVGRQGLVRGVRGARVFVDAADLGGDTIRAYPAGAPWREMLLVPVTADSVHRVRETCRRPPMPLRGVADWADYFAPPSIHHSAGGRLELDQFDALLGGQAELGLSSIAWSVGRSWVEYNSRLAEATRFPCMPLESVDPQSRAPYVGRTTMIAMTDPLDYVLAHRTAYGVTILPWLAMQRHYGVKAYGGMFSSKWFREHPEWHEWPKNGRKPTGSTVCYFFPEVRRERVDILCEVAERTPDGLVVGCCRQVPMLLYHPEMVAAYKQRTGVDPQAIDAADGQKYVDWIRWRADFFTQVLRDLKTRLGPIRQRTGRPIPVVVRVPTKGLFYNLAQGLDLETWCRERLVDQFQLDPLEDCAGRGENHDVRPYLELGRRYHLPVWGGVNGNTFGNYPALLRRAIGLCRAGVDGIELYESNNFAVSNERRWLVPLLGNPAEAERFLEQSNLDACWPIWSRAAAAGFDNHSFRGQWSVHGRGASSL